MLVLPGLARSLFYCFNAESSSNLLFGMGQRPFQVSLHCLSGGVWLSFLDGFKYRRVLLCIAHQQLSSAGGESHRLTCLAEAAEIIVAHPAFREKPDTVSSLREHCLLSRCFCDSTRLPYLPGA